MSVQAPPCLTIQFAELRTAEAAALHLLAPPADVVVIMPYIDRAAAERSARHLAARAGVQGLLLAIDDSDRQGFISIANQVYRRTEGRYVAYVAQDAYAGRQWLKRALDAVQKTGKGLLGFNDGKWMGALAGFGLVDRTWADGNYAGDLFHANYIRHYADVELTVLAISDKQYCYDANAVLIEVDWEKDRAAVNPGDRALYKQRVVDGLGGRVQSPQLLTMFS
jgi:hypothetical protein